MTTIQTMTSDRLKITADQLDRGHLFYFGTDGHLMLVTAKHHNVNDRGEPTVVVYAFDTFANRNHVIHLSPTRPAYLVGDICTVLGPAGSEQA